MASSASTMLIAETCAPSIVPEPAASIPNCRTCRRSATGEELTFSASLDGADLTSGITQMSEENNAPMSEDQATDLKVLGKLAGQPGKYAPDLSHSEAGKRIDDLKKEKGER
jgi:hypothetical protein